MTSARLVVISGWTGAGKSTIADAVADHLGCSVASFDWLMSALRSFPDLWATIELPVERQRRVGTTLLGRAAEQQLRRGASVVLDLVARAEAVAAFTAVAARHSAELRVIECTCSDLDVHRSRVEGRTRAIPGWYELTWDHVAQGRKKYVPLGGPKLELDAVDPLDANIAAALAFIR